MYTIYFESTDGKIMAIDNLNEAKEKIKYFPRRKVKLRKCVTSGVLVNATHINEYYDAGLVEWEGVVI